MKNPAVAGLSKISWCPEEESKKTTASALNAPPRLPLGHIPIPLNTPRLTTQNQYKLRPFPANYSRKMAHFRNVGNKIRAEVEKIGVRESRMFVSKAEAKAWAAARELEILRAGGDRKGKGKTLHGAIDRFLKDEWPKRGEQRNEKIRLERIKREIPDVDILKLGPEHVSAWRDTRLKKVKGASVRRDMNLLKTVLETARRDWGWIETNPMADVKRPAPSPDRNRLLTDAEIQAVVAWSEWQEGAKPKNQMQRMAICLLIALETAMRAGEIGKAVVSGRVARLATTKNGDPREVPLSKRAVELYALYEPIPASVIDSSFRYCRDACGLSGFTFHDSRANALTRLAKKVDVLTLSKISGHRNISQLMCYYRESAESIADRLG